MFKLVLEKAEQPEIKLPTSVGSLKKQESSIKTSTSALLTILKPLTLWHNKLENSERDRNSRPPDLPPEKSVCRCRFSYAYIFLVFSTIDHYKMLSIVPCAIQ